jgi:Flp pilus assembly protein TadB
MESIENDILENVELEGITQEQIDSMSNYEIKEFQRNQSNDKINAEKKKTEFALVSTAFFLLVAGFLFMNPILTVYAAIVPMVVSIVFAIRANYCHENLKFERESRMLLESFFEGNDL